VKSSQQTRCPDHRCKYGHFATHTYFGLQTNWQPHHTDRRPQWLPGGNKPNPTAINPAAIAMVVKHDQTPACCRRRPATIRQRRKKRITPQRVKGCRIDIPACPDEVRKISGHQYESAPATHEFKRVLIGHKNLKTKRPVVTGVPPTATPASHPRAGSHRISGQKRSGKRDANDKSPCVGK